MIKMRFGLRTRESFLVSPLKSTFAGPVKFECEVCHKLFANTTSYTVHQRIHKGEEPVALLTFLIETAKAHTPLSFLDICLKRGSLR